MKISRMRVPSRQFGKILAVWDTAGAITTIASETLLATEYVDLIMSEKFLFILESEVPIPSVHGAFRDFADLPEIAKAIGMKFQLWTYYHPDDSIPGVLEEKFLLFHRDSPGAYIGRQSVGEISFDEIDALLRANNPESYGEPFRSYVCASLLEEEFTVLRKNGKIVFVHILKRKGDAFEGVYLWSSLPFPQTVREFFNSIERLGNAPISTLIHEKNFSSLRLHELMGFLRVSERHYRFIIDQVF